MRRIKHIKTLYQLLKKSWSEQSLIAYFYRQSLFMNKIFYLFVCTYLLITIGCTTEVSKKSIPADIKADFDKTVAEAEAKAADYKCDEARDLYDVAKNISYHP